LQHFLFKCGADFSRHQLRHARRRLNACPRTEQQRTGSPREHFLVCLVVVLIGVHCFDDIFVLMFNSKMILFFIHSP
jgi:hypothetical protein